MTAGWLISLLIGFVQLATYRSYGHGKHILDIGKRRSRVCVKILQTVDFPAFFKFIVDGESDFLQSGLAMGVYAGHANTGLSQRAWQSAHGGLVADVAVLFAPM